MLKVIGKIVHDGKLIGYRVEEDGVAYNLAERQLYSSMFFDMLREQGYVYHNYDGDITDAQGLSLKDYVETTDYISDGELYDLMEINDNATGILEEKDICQHFKRDVSVQVIETKEPVNPTLKTREEFNSYIERQRMSVGKGLATFEPFNPNTFTAKDARFTLEEVASHSGDERRRWSWLFTDNYMRYADHIKAVYQGYGVNQDKPDMIALIKNYLSYGIPGLNVDIVDISVDMSPRIPVKDLHKPSSTPLLSYGVTDNDTGAFYCKYQKAEYPDDLRGGELVDTSAVILSESVETIQRESIGSVTTRAYGLKDKNPQVVATIMSKDGFTAKFITDGNYFAIMRGSELILPAMPLFCCKTISDVFIPLSDIFRFGVDYISDFVMVHTYVKDKVEASIRKTPYKSSYELLVDCGVSPLHIPNYMIARAKNGDVLRPELSSDEIQNLLGCMNVVKKGFSKKILEKYGADDPDIEDKNFWEQLDALNDKVNELSAANAYLVPPPGCAPQDNPTILTPGYAEYIQEIIDNEIGSANFVREVLDGTTNIGQFAIGYNLDHDVQYGKYIDIVFSVYKLYKDTVDSSCSMNEFLDNHITKYINEQILFPERKQGYIGAVVDKTKYMAEMSSKANTWVYVDSVFRENGNNLVNDVTRHYGFKCIEVQVDNKYLKPMYNSVAEEIGRGLEAQGMPRMWATDAGYALASECVFRAIFDHDLEYVKEDAARVYEFPINYIDERYVVQFKLAEEYIENYLKLGGSYWNIKYCSCYDFSTYQFDEYANTCNYYCINACVTPWRVSPKERFVLKEYNIFLNAYPWDTLKTLLPESFLQQVKDFGGKIEDNLIDSFDNLPLIPNMMAGMDDADEVLKKAEAGTYLEPGEFESLNAYMIRTTQYCIVKNKANGICVKSPLLKSDIDYSVIKAGIFVDGVEDEETYFDEFEKKTFNRYLSQYEPRTLKAGWHISLREDSAYVPSPERVTLSPFTFEDITGDVINYNARLAMADFNRYITVTFTRDTMWYGTQSISIQDITSDFMQGLVSEKIAIQLDADSYVVRSLSGYVKISI